jgi:hypothetical protein
VPPPATLGLPAAHRLVGCFRWCELRFALVDAAGRADGHCGVVFAQMVYQYGLFVSARRTDGSAGPTSCDEEQGEEKRNY